jgi:squalene synthase HpnC
MTSAPTGTGIAVPVRRPEQVRRTENFPVALRILPATTRRHLLALYGYARYIDDLGDEPLCTPGADRLGALDEFEAQVRDLFAGRPARHPVLRELAPAVRERNLPLDPLVRLIEANRVDQRTTRYLSFDQLIGYCTLSANPVGELVLHVFGKASPTRVALADRICTALQLIEHLQDIGEDRRRGRVYLPAEDMERFGVSDDDLSRPSAGQSLRDLVTFEAARAQAWLQSGAPLVATLRGWSRLAVSGYVAGGRAALAALARAGYDPLARPARPGRGDVLGHWLIASLRSPG